MMTFQLTMDDARVQVLHHSITVTYVASTGCAVDFTKSFCLGKEYMAKLMWNKGMSSSPKGWATTANSSFIKSFVEGYGIY